MGKRGAQRPPKPPGEGPGGGKGKAGGAKQAKPFPVHEHLGEHLKALYDDVIDEPIPDRFRQLLDELERQQSYATAKAPAKDAGKVPFKPPHKAR